MYSYPHVRHGGGIGGGWGGEGFSGGVFRTEHDMVGWETTPKALFIWMDGWMDGWMDRWMDGWMDGYNPLISSGYVIRLWI